MKTIAVAPTPFCTPRASMPMTSAHITTSGTSTPATGSAVTPGSLTCRNSPMKKPAGSAPHALVKEKNA